MRTTLCIILLLLLTGNCFSQQESDREIFERMQQQMRAEFDEYRKQNRKEYAAYLRQTWIEYQLYKGIDPFMEPKPDTIPAAPDQEELSIQILKAKESSGLLEIPNLPEIIMETKETAAKAHHIKIPFYGSSLPLSYSLKQYKLKSTEEEDITNLWESLDTKEVSSLLADLVAIKLDKKLNDWAFFLLIEHTANQLPQLQDANSRIIFRHFALHTFGYEVQMGRINKTLVLLIPFREMIFKHQFLTKNGQKFFLFADKNLIETGGVYTLPIPTNVGRPLCLQFTENILLEYSPYHIKRTYQHFTVSGAINTNRISFFKDFPQTDFRVYANALVDKPFEQELLEQLQNQINNKELPAALNWLLHFTQSAFNYATDQAQFGYEKYFFPEETFFYPASDCEDRAILFSYLVRKLLKKEVVLLNYSDHVATAVLIDKEIPGTYIQTDGKRYLLCDPSYIGAEIGQCMPKYKKEMPAIFKLM